MTREVETCSCKEPEFQWWRENHRGSASHLSEDGWKCMSCDKPFPGEPPGYSPQLDRERICEKINGLMLDLQELEFCSFSNSDDGEFCCATVADQCVEEKRYDAESICQFIFENRARGGDYWRKVGEGIMAGKDPRNRCHAEGCGRLARGCLISGGSSTHYCDNPEHRPNAF